MGKHALPSVSTKQGKHAGDYDLVKEIEALVKELAKLIRRMR